MKCIFNLGGVLDPQMDTGVAPQHREGCGCWCEKMPQKATLMDAKSLKSHPYEFKICDKGTFEWLFLAKFEFSVLTFVKIVKNPPLWVQKCVKPYHYGFFQSYGCNFFKQLQAFPGAHCKLQLWQLKKIWKTIQRILVPCFPDTWKYHLWFNHIVVLLLPI